VSDALHILLTTNAVHSELLCMMLYMFLLHHFTMSSSQSLLALPRLSVAFQNPEQNWLYQSTIMHSTRVTLPFYQGMKHVTFYLKHRLYIHCILTRTTLDCCKSMK